MKASEIRELLERYPQDWQNTDTVQGYYRCLELLFPLVEALEKHHEMWNENGDCLSECGTTCKTLTQLADKLRKHEEIHIRV